jgi:hypothetical protein
MCERMTFMGIVQGEVLCRVKPPTPAPHPFCSDHRTKERKSSFEWDERFMLPISCEFVVELSECSICIEEPLFIGPHLSWILWMQ